MDCRGTETRQWIVNKYDVVPVAHIQLLAGQTKHSDAGATIENDYYIFHATNRETGAKEIIQCGMGAARDLIHYTERVVQIGILEVVQEINRLDGTLLLSNYIMPLCG